MRFRCNPDLVVAPEKLLHGANPKHLFSIMRRGLYVGESKSPHRTKTRDAIYLTDSMLAALAYSTADPGKGLEAFVAVVKTDGLPLEPDYDDVSAEFVSESLLEVNKAFKAAGLGPVKVGDELSQEQIDILEEEMQSWGDGDPGNPTFEVDGEGRLSVRPVVAFPAAEPGADDSAWDTMPDEVTQTNNGGYVVECLQFRTRRPVPPSKILGAFLSEGSAKMARIPWDRRNGTETVPDIQTPGYPDIQMGYFPARLFRAS